MLTNKNHFKTITCHFNEHRHFFINQKNINIGLTNQPQRDFVVELCFPSYLRIELENPLGCLRTMHASGPPYFGVSMPPLQDNSGWKTHRGSSNHIDPLQIASIPSNTDHLTLSANYTSRSCWIESAAQTLCPAGSEQLAAELVVTVSQFLAFLRKSFSKKTFSTSRPQYPLLLLWHPL